MADTVASIVAAHRAGRRKPDDTVAACYRRIREHHDAAVFITLRREEDALDEAQRLSDDDPSLPLYGVPVAIKDNIDVAGLPTSAGCPAFVYKPARDATVVERLRRAGAIVIGKTNMDQFATGLVGVRSPYGIPRNPFDASLIPGGSSSGSAVAVAAGLVPLALGTDTAGSGRVPAAFNNIVGLKPSLGMVSTAGVVPACRTLDCVSIFALTTDDAYAALNVMAGADPEDPYARARPLNPLGPLPMGLRVGVPLPGQRLFFGDYESADAYDGALARLGELGATIVEIDIEPFYEAARLLYDGPWVAERYITVAKTLAAMPDSLLPVTRDIILAGRQQSAVDTFAALYRLEELRRLSEQTFRRIDMLAVPTAPTIYSLNEIHNDPIELNNRLGTYTNFVNLLDLCGLAVPAALSKDLRFGITLVAPAGHEAAIGALGRIFHADTQLTLGATGSRPPPLAALLPTLAPGELSIAVVGAHLSGMPLNPELRALDARLIETVRTAPDYRLYALDGTPPRPGLLRVAADAGSTIEAEIWALSAERFGRFVASVPAPLSIGTITLSDGREVKGFLVEAAAALNARDITHFGGWRAYAISELALA